MIDRTTSPQSHAPERVVFRNLALPVSVFDRIKDVQRAIEAAQGPRLSITQVVSRIVREHPITAASEVQTNVPALFISR